MQCCIHVIEFVKSIAHTLIKPRAKFGDFVHSIIVISLSNLTIYFELKTKDF